MTIAINLSDLCYPGKETQAMIMAGDWPELQPHQWAILCGKPFLFMPWNIETVTRDEFEKCLHNPG